jgi:hypothetical protein
MATKRKEERCRFAYYIFRVVGNCIIAIFIISVAACELDEEFKVIGLAPHAYTKRLMISRIFNMKFTKYVLSLHFSRMAVVLLPRPNYIFSNWKISGGTQWSITPQFPRFWTSLNTVELAASSSIDVRLACRRSTLDSFC